MRRSVVRESGSARHGGSAILAIAAAMFMPLAGTPKAMAQGGGTLPCRYEVTAIIPGPFCPGMGNSPMFARGISNHDPPWVVGFYTECSIGSEKAFVWTGSGPVQTLNLPVSGGNPSAFAFGVNDHGQVVGSYYITNGWLGYVYDVPKGVLTPLHPGMPGGGCVARAINNAGMVVGSRSPASTNSNSNAFIWQNGVFTDLGFMNGPNSEAWAVSQNGIVVGWTGTAIHTNNARAFVHEKGQTTLLPLPANGVACAGWDVNTRGEIVGGWKIQVPSGPPPSRGALWQGGSVIDLGLLVGSLSAAARAVSADGRVIVGASGQSACLWRDTIAANFNTVVPATSGLFLTDAHAINQRGQILCEASSQFGRVAVVLSPVHAPIGDVTLDCKVNVNDLLGVINAWGQTSGPADVNGDGIVNYHDLVLVIQNWTFNQ